jgi:hypothetical protein
VIVEVAGNSMEPSLPRGSRVRIGPADGPLAIGDVVLFQGRTQPVLHRVVAVFLERGREHVVHRGDAGGGMGLVPREAVLGRVVEVLSPATPLPTLERMDAAARRAFGRARLRGFAYVIARRAACRMGLDRTPLRRAAGWFWRRA